MSAVADKIMKRVRAKGRGWVFTPRDLIDFGTRASVDMALSRLVQAGEVRRIGRGLYDWPRLHDKLGALSPDPTDIARAASVQSGDKLAPSGAAAANRLGLSTQVPAKASYATTGRSRVKRAAGRSVTLRHSRAPVIDNVPESVNALIQALSQLGRGKADDDAIRRLAARIDERDLQILTRVRPQMTGWMGDVVLKVGATRRR